MTNTAYCPDCDGRIVLNPLASLGKRLTCPHCEADLEIIGVEPLELDWAYDWSWDDDEDDNDDEDDDDDDDDWDD